LSDMQSLLKKHGINTIHIAGWEPIKSEQQTDLTWDELVEELTGLGWTIGKACVCAWNVWNDIEITVYAKKRVMVEDVVLEGIVNFTTTSLRHARAIALAITQGDK